VSKRTVWIVERQNHSGAWETWLGRLPRLTRVAAHADADDLATEYGGIYRVRAYSTRPTVKRSRSKRK